MDHLNRIKEILFVITFLQLSVYVGAQPKNIHLSWTGKNTVETGSTMAITWNSTQPDNAVRYGLDPNYLNYLEKPASNSGNKLKDNFIYKAALKRLKEDTKYYYQCGSDKSGWSNTYSFSTAPKKGAGGKYTVGVWGDTQNNKGNLQFEETSVVVEQLKRYPLNLVLHMGDIVENGSVVSSWDNFLKITQPINATTPFMPATGNHDVGNNHQELTFQKPFPIYYDLFNLPNDYINYSYDYGNIHFVAINSGFAQGAAKVNQLLFEKDSPEYQWLDADLRKARKNKRTDWIILYAHYPMYAYGVSLVPQWQKNVTPILDKYKVDLCLTGHRHVYERHTAIRNNIILKQDNKHSYNKPLGTVYITNGSAGGSLQGIGGKDMPSMVFTPDEKMYTYAIMTIERPQLKYEVFNNQGALIDHFNIIK